MGLGLRFGFWVWVWVWVWVEVRRSEYIELSVMRPPPGPPPVAAVAKRARSSMCTSRASILEVSRSAHLPLCATTTASKRVCTFFDSCTHHPPPPSSAEPRSVKMPPLGETQQSCRMSSPPASCSAIAPMPPMPM